VSTSHLESIAGRFALAGPVESVEVMTGGHINDSYRVTARRTDGRPASYLLQHVNPTVFPDASRVMENIAYVTRHLAAHRRAGRTTRETLTLVPTIAGAAWMEDAARSCWRVYAFIAGTHAVEHTDQPTQALEASRALGEFLALLADYNGPELHVTIDGFHDTSARFAQLEAAVDRDAVGRAGTVRDDIGLALAHRALAQVLPPYLASGAVPLRVVHNDAKISNVLLDDATGQARCVVDLDTVMPGSLLHDFGDMVRSMTTPTDEDEADAARVGVRLDLFEAVARGFLETAGPILTPTERSLLVFAGRLITLEQAVRFLIDYLDGDRYYRAPGEQSLRRVRAQLRLFETLTAHANELEDIVAGIA